MVPRPAYNFSILIKKYRLDTFGTLILVKLILKDMYIVLKYNRLIINIIIKIYKQVVPMLE